MKNTWRFKQSLSSDKSWAEISKHLELSLPKYSLDTENSVIKLSHGKY
jgi:hypothetical protein